MGYFDSFANFNMLNMNLYNFTNPFMSICNPVNYISTTNIPLFSLPLQTQTYTYQYLPSSIFSANPWYNIGINTNNQNTDETTNTTSARTDTSGFTQSTSTTNNNNNNNKTTSSNRAYYGKSYTAVSDNVKKYGNNAKFIEKLHPEMQKKVMALCDYAKSQGISFSISSGFRSAAQQQALQYKNKNGQKIAAAVGSSPHEYGIAIDFKSSNNEKIGKYARDVLGMRWGGDWGGSTWARETWHVDMANTISKVKA